MAQYKIDPSSDRWYWFLAIALILTGGLAPIGILMLVIRLLNGNEKKRSSGRPSHTSEPQNLGAKTNAYAAPAPSAPKTKKGRGGLILDRMAKKAKNLTLWGGIITAFFGLICVCVAAEYLWVLPDIAWFLEETVPLLCFTAVGGGMLWTGLRRKKRVLQYRQYLNMIGQKKSVSVSALASATGSSPEQVRATLEDMMECDLFPAGYLDYGGDKLILSGGLAEPVRKTAPAPAKEEQETQGENAVLAEIRAINDAIDNEKLSAQIDRIGMITAKIFDYQKSHPAKSPQLHSFLSYYLPTTLKILRAYAQLEDQEVDGENITAAMERIESMMDKVVEGFETQLDKLFQGDAMDITADVEVLERMLAKDGLSEQPGMTLGT